MKETIYELEVRPTIPDALSGLVDLSNNLHYSWDRNVRGLFFRLDHKLWDQWEAKAEDPGYKGVNLPMEEIDPAFAKQFCIYGWALQSDYGKQDVKPADFKPFPVHFDSCVFNGKDRKIKIYPYRAIISVEFQEKLYEELKFMWFDLTEWDGRELRKRLESEIYIETVKGKAEEESWF